MRLQGDVLGVSCLGEVEQGKDFRGNTLVSNGNQCQTSDYIVFSLCDHNDIMEVFELAIDSQQATHTIPIV